MQNTANIKNLRQDNVNVDVKIVDAAKATGLKMRPGLESLIVVEGEVVRFASQNYGLVRNENFFGAFDEKLTEAGILYSKRSINNNNRNFAVDYILEDENMHVDLKKGKDIVKPMIRAINSYDGSQQTIGEFGVYRQICSNGLHIAETQVGFKLRHRGNVQEVVLPKIEELIAQFMDNEFFTLHKKFHVLAESPVPNIEEFVKYVLGKTGLAKYEKSEKQPDQPSKAAEHIIATMRNEATTLGVQPNLWLGYNAFNEYIHNSNNKLFTLKEEADKKMFGTVLAMAAN